MALWLGAAAAFLLGLGAVVLGTASPAAAQGGAEPVIEVNASGTQGIALGATFDNVADALEAPLVLSDERTMPEGQPGRSIDRDGETIVWLASTDDSEIIDLIVFVDPIYRTADGIGPGSTVAEARAVYGAALTESVRPGSTGETISFVSGPAGITFVTSLDGENQSGRYRDGRIVSFAPDPAGTIEALLLGCDDADCATLLGGAPTQDSSAPTSAPTSPPTVLASTGVESRLMAVAMFLVGGGCLAVVGARRATPAC